MNDTPPITDLLYPLMRFYELQGLPLPAVEQLPGASIPEPFKSLLVHDRDMTPTLEAHFQETMALRIIHAGMRDHPADNSYCREVVLFGSRSGKPVEYGSIKILLDNFDTLSKKEILDGRLPLGAILRKNAVRHISAPRAFFRIASDAIMQTHFNLSAPTQLYGRRNRLTTLDGGTLADIVEILAP